ncbi:flagellin [Arthrobacter ginkgonis]|uniref:Flagellin n=1 Tax=Arthrobacter ginkgonis TaxID=1630594 RepID=A0ABP7BXS6_9MICC
MGMTVNTNLAANSAYRNLSATQNTLSKSMEKLSSGLRINRAADDAAGMAISEGLRSQVNGLTQASRNAQDGINMLQTAEGGLAEAHSILQRVRDLAVQGGNDSNNAASRTAIKTEIDALGDELIRMSDSINFNGIKLNDGATSGPAGDGKLNFQVGAGSAATEQISIDLSGADLNAIGTAVKALTVDTAANALASVGSTDTQIGNVSTVRATIGATQNRLESTIKHVNVSKENLAAAGSSIRDTDMAAEMVKYTAANVMSQAGTAMLAQANQSTQGVLQLLR